MAVPISSSQFLQAVMNYVSSEIYCPVTLKKIRTGEEKEEFSISLI